MSGPETAPCGTWRSPLTARIVASGALRLSGVIATDDNVYWVEGRPEEGGRSVIVKRTADGRIVDVSPPGTNVRARVHEYGGAAFIVARGVIYYSEFADHRLYRLRPGHAPEPLTPPGESFYADCCVDPSRGRLVCVREDHTQHVGSPAQTDREAVTTLVSLSLDGPPHEGQTVASGHDF